MNFTIAFFVGCMTLALMMLIKIPIKAITEKLADRTFSEEDNHIINRRYNLIIILMVFVVACIIYYFVLSWLGDDHFKFCCSLKAGCIAVALYAAFERFI